MTSRVIDGNELGEYLSSLDSCSFADPIWNTYSDDFTADSGDPFDPAREDGSCLRGLASAIGIEAAAAMFLLGAWRVLQMLR